jgi:hypothetical protein
MRRGSPLKANRGAANAVSCDRRSAIPAVWFAVANRLHSREDGQARGGAEVDFCDRSRRSAPRRWSVRFSAPTPAPPAFSAATMFRSTSYSVEESLAERTAVPAYCAGAGVFQPIVSATARTPTAAGRYVFDNMRSLSQNYGTPIILWCAKSNLVYRMSTVAFNGRLAEDSPAIRLTCSAST